MKYHEIVGFSVVVSWYLVLHVEFWWFECTSIYRIYWYIEMFEDNKIHVFMKRDTVDLFLAWQQPKEHAAPNWCKHQWNKSYKPANVQLFSNSNNNDRQNAEYITDSMDPPGCWQVDRCGTGSCYDLCQVRWCRPLFGRHEAIGVKTMISYSPTIYSYFDI